MQDQASTLAELHNSDTAYSPGSRVLEAGCGVGAQTALLAGNSPEALITSIDISEGSLVEAALKAAAAGRVNVRLERRDIFNLAYERESFDRIFACFVLEHLAEGIPLRQ